MHDAENPQSGAPRRALLRGLAMGGLVAANPARAATPEDVMTADSALLRAHGAKLDGIADDLPAFQAIVDGAARVTRPGLPGPVVAFALPAGNILLGGPLRTGACSVSLLGMGQDVTVLTMRAGAAGLIEHGSAAGPSSGYLQLQDLSLVDGNPKGSGVVGVSVRFAPEAPQAAMTWQGVALRHWTRPAVITNCPRNWHCENVTVFGPDFAMQPGAGLEIASTADFAQGCFTYVFINVLVANYCWGWRYDIKAPLEGQRFLSCTCYNGWGMVQVRVRPARNAAINVDATYHSLLWSFVDCDWQGLGYALDLQGCRQVQVRGGFFIANRNTDRLPTPDGRPRRRCMSFVDCLGVLLDGVKFDVFSGTEDSLSLVFVDAATRFFRARDTDILSLATIHAAWEFAEAGHVSPEDNTMGEFDTNYVGWAGGEKVCDPGGNQLAQSLVREHGGDVGTAGVWTLRQVVRSATMDAQGRIAIALATRPDGKPFFRKGTPTIVAQLAGNAETGSLRLRSATSTSCVLECTGLATATRPDITLLITGP